MEPTVGNPKLYTPIQIRAGSFLGGPIASVYFLRENFRVLGKVSEAKTTLAWGIAFVVCLLALLPFLPARFPNYLIPLAYSIAAGSIAEKWQLQKQAIVNSGRYQFQSNWRVFGLAVLFLVAFLIVGAVTYFCLVALGVITGPTGIGLE
jgi:hypothetical protein